jgi:hypothetical protein
MQKRYCCSPTTLVLWIALGVIIGGLIGYHLGSRKTLSSSILPWYTEANLQEMPAE